MARAWVAMGSNLGDREANLRAAVEGLRRRAGRVEAVSRFHETEPVGPPGQGPYLNAAAVVETSLPPEELLRVLLGIELERGRDRSAAAQRWGPRTLDLDLLLYGDLVLDTPGLTLPHPRLHERRFVLAPLAEVAAGAVHPTLGRTVAELLAALEPAAGNTETRPMRVALTRTFGFESAHWLPCFPEGHKCRRMHGHSFKVDVVIEGEVDPAKGYLVDFGDIKRVLQPIEDRLDHRVLNDIEGLENPTAELLARWIYDRVKPDLPLLKLVRVRETCTSAAEYAGS